MKGFLNKVQKHVSTGTPKEEVPKVIMSITPPSQDMINKLCDDCTTAGKKSVIKNFINSYGTGSVNARNKHGSTPLCKAATHGYVDYVELLLDSGANINYTDNDALTALHYAANGGALESVQVLISRGAALNVKDKDGCTALFRASKWGRSDVVRALLAAGADPTIKNNDGRTALDITHKDDIKTLLSDACQEAERVVRFEATRRIDKERLRQVTQQTAAPTAEKLARKESERAAREVLVKTDDTEKETGGERRAAELEAKVAADVRSQFIAASISTESTTVGTGVGTVCDSGKRTEKVLLEPLPPPSPPAQPRKLSPSPPPPPSLVAHTAATNGIERAWAVLNEPKYVSDAAKLKELLEETLVIESAAELENLLKVDGWEIYVDSIVACLKVGKQVSFREHLGVVAPTKQHSASMLIEEMNESVEISPKLWERRERSSGESIIVSGLFSSKVMGHDKVLVKLKMSMNEKVLEHERRMMWRLYNRSSDCFIRPFTLKLLHGSQAIKCIDSSPHLYAIAMEEGIENLHTYIMKYRLSPNEIRVHVEALVDIVCAAMSAGVVLVDFKLDNVVRVLVNNSKIVLKAIDFEHAADIDGECRPATPSYMSPEVARTVLSPHTSKRLHANSKMDSFSLGLTVFEMITKKSFWQYSHGIEIDTDERLLSKIDYDIMNACTNLTDELVTSTLEHALPGDDKFSLRRWLARALKVKQLEREDPESLRNNTSLIGSKVPTSVVDLNAFKNDIIHNMDAKAIEIMQNTDEKVAQVITSIDNLSDQVLQGFLNVDSHLRQEMTPVTLGGTASVALIQSMHDDLLRIKEQTSPVAMRNSFQSMQKSLSDELKTILESTILSHDSHQEMNNKVDLLIHIVSDIKDDMTVLAQNINLLRSIATKPDPRMPPTFIIKVNIESKGNVKPTTMTGKLINKMKKIKKSAFRIVCKTFTVTFVCPVTMREVLCGPLPKQKGYNFSFPSDHVKKLIPVLKAGVIVLKVALATQGLGAAVPDLSEFMPGFNASESFESMCSHAQEYAHTINEFCDTYTVDSGSEIDSAESTDSADNTVGKLSKSANEEDQLTQSMGSVSLVYEYLRGKEGLNDGQPLRLTGLRYVQSRKDCTWAWVSDEGLPMFHTEGAAALL